MSRRRGGRRRGSSLFSLMVLIGLVVLALVYSQTLRDKAQQTPSNDQKESIVVSSVVDGDTFKDTGGQTYRLIGIDTPESKAFGANAYKNVPFGKIASDYTKSLIDGRTVFIEDDVSATDKYSRRLVYVYLEDGSMLNEKLIKEGYARLMTVPPNVRYESLFAKAQEEARGKGIGVWEDYDAIFK